jgi:hypothetical protein
LCGIAEDELVIYTCLSFWLLRAHQDFSLLSSEGRRFDKRQPCEEKLERESRSVSAVI